MRHLVISTILTVVTASTWSASSNRSEAAPPDAKKYAITNLDEVDADFAYQGEYAGSMTDSTRGRREVGLQVIARGDGQFEAVLCDGGLPGAGWDRTTKTAAAGALADGAVRLEGSGLVIRADGQQADIHDASGALIGELQKVQRVSPSIGAIPDPRAVILFDGVSTDNLDDASVTADGLLEVGASTKMPVQDFRLHLEFRLPYMPYTTSQGRANSGVYIQRRYEVQILDSFGLEGVFNECGALYRQRPPELNMCLPPLSWQTYDIWFRAARWDDEGNKTENARITVLLNGIPVQDDYEIIAKTGAGQPEGPDPGKILFQNHSNPVNFRNMWIVLGVGERESEQVYVSTDTCVRRRHICLVRRIICCIRARRCR